MGYEFPLQFSYAQYMAACIMGIATSSPNPRGIMLTKASNPQTIPNRKIDKRFPFVTAAEIFIASENDVPGRSANTQ